MHKKERAPVAVGIILGSSVGSDNYSIVWTFKKVNMNTYTFDGGMLILI